MSTTNRKHLWTGIFIVVVFSATALLLAALAWKYIPLLIPEVGPTAVTAFTTLAGSGLTLLLTKRWERKKEIELEHRKQKGPLYEEFIAFLFKVMATNNTANAIRDEEMTEFVVRFTKGLTIWGSNDVILKYGAFRQAAAARPEPQKLLILVEDILLSIRADLGHSQRLPSGSVLRLFISDFDKANQET